MQILVRNNNVDQALKALKRKMQREGIFREMKCHGHYEKPSEKKVREKVEAIRRARKLARKRAQREGLIPRQAQDPDHPGADADPASTVVDLTVSACDRMPPYFAISVLLLIALWQ